MEIRSYGEGDYQQVVELAVDPLEQDREVAKGVMSWASKSKDAEIFVAGVEDKIRGFIMMEYPIGERWAQIGNIGWIAVHGNFQRKGIGSKLIQVGEESARKMGMRKIYVEASVKDDYAICFYVMNGLLPEGRKRDYHRDGEDGIILGKHL